MKGNYKVIVDGDLKSYTDYYDIPMVLDNVISFVPDYPPSPHTKEEHELIESFTEKFQELMRREYASSN
jgi:hypothetical protein